MFWMQKNAVPNPAYAATTKTKHKVENDGKGGEVWRNNLKHATDFTRPLSKNQKLALSCGIGIQSAT